VPSRVASATRIAALLLAIATTLACGSFRLPFSFVGSQQMYGSTMTEDELRNELSGYAARFGAYVSDASEDISSESQDRAIRRRTLIWQMKMIPPVQEAAFADTAQEGFLRVLGLAVAQDQYLTTGEGRNLFGAQQHIAVEAAVWLKDDAVEIASRLLPPDKLATVMDEVAALVDKNPIVGRDFSLQRIVQARTKLTTSSSLLGVLTLPLAPFKALEGVDSGAESIRDFNVTARQFSLIVAQLPDELRTQMELFLYDVEDRQTVIESVAAMQAMAESAQRASLAIEKLPADLQKSLADSKGALEEANKALLTAKDVMAPLAQTSENLKLASDVWGQVLERDPNAAPSRPFDIREWQETAAQIGISANELRAFATEIQTISGGAGTPLEAAIDRLSLRAAQLVALFFALLVAYRLLAWRLGRTRRES
jgi:hypothetical protein